MKVRAGVPEPLLIEFRHSAKRPVATAPIWVKEKP